MNRRMDRRAAKTTVTTFIPFLRAPLASCVLRPEEEHPSAAVLYTDTLSATAVFTLLQLLCSLGPPSGREG